MNIRRFKTLLNTFQFIFKGLKNSLNVILSDCLIFYFLIIELELHPIVVKNDYTIVVCEKLFCSHFTLNAKFWPFLLKSRPKVSNMQVTSSWIYDSNYLSYSLSSSSSWESLFASGFLFRADLNFSTVISADNASFLN